MRVNKLEDIRIFPDTDVIVSSLFSRKGAAHFIINDLKVTKLTTQLSLKETRGVAKRLSLPNKVLAKSFNKEFEITNLHGSPASLVEKYGSYLLDMYDSHVLAGAVITKARFLITYNLKHFKLDVIKGDFGIIVISPGDFMQFIRANYKI